MKITTRLIAGSAVIFVGLCLLHYFSQRPLWLDENYIVENITQYSYRDIFGPLKTQQAFPRVYLTLIKAFSSLFDFHVYSLRFLPLICMLVAFFLWMKIYRRNFHDDWLLVLATLSFASSYRLTYYAAELKQYSMDVLIVAVFCLFLNHQRTFEDKKPTLSTYLWAILLPLSILFSYAGLFVFWIVPLNFLLLFNKNKRVLPVLYLNVIVSMICFAMVYLIDLQYSMYARGLMQYWQSYFLCTDSLLCFLDTFNEGVKRLVIYWNGAFEGYQRLALIFIPLCMIALIRHGIAQWKRDQWKIFKVESLCLVIFLELIILGLMKRYPFTGERITLFFAPFAYFMIIQGIHDLGRFPKLRIGLLGYYGLYCLICLWHTFMIHLNLYF